MDCLQVKASIKMSNTNENAIVGERLRQIRKYLKMTQAGMGKKLGYSTSTYCEFENGNIGISTLTYMKLSKIFNVNLEFLVNGRGGMFYKAISGTDDQKNIEYTFDKNIDSKEKLLSMMTKSTFFCHNVLALAQEFFHTKGALILEMLDEPEPK